MLRLEECGHGDIKEALIKSSKQTEQAAAVEEIPREAAAGADWHGVLRFAQDDRTKKAKVSQLP